VAADTHPSRRARFAGGPLERLRRLRRSRRDTAPDLPPRDETRVVHQIERMLTLADTGSQRLEAASLAATWSALDAVGRERFLRLVATRFGHDHDAIESALAGWASAPGRTGRVHAAVALREATTPAYVRLLHLFTGLDNGVKLVVDLRGELRKLDLSDPDLRAFDEELAVYLTALFAVGLLELRRITWDSPAALLERLIDYEAVHAIESWADLKNRLASDRRCYAFFHPAMPDEPLVFVEIALTHGMADHLEPLLDEDAPVIDATRADTANFYSITNCQPGLAGVNLGNELLEAVVDRLSHELPSLRTYATLSPIPGFRAWAEKVIANDELTPRERSLLPPTSELREILADDRWADDPELTAQLRRGLTGLCARYLVSKRADGRVLDPVGNFHLSNGASVERVNWLANPTPPGMAASYGLMVNYRYDPERIAARAAAYATDRTVATADAVRDLVG